MRTRIWTRIRVNINGRRDLVRLRTDALTFFRHLALYGIIFNRRQLADSDAFCTWQRNESDTGIN